MATPEVPADVDGHLSDDDLSAVTGGTDPNWVIGVDNNLGTPLQPLKSVGG